MKSQLDIKLGQFNQKEPNVLVTKIKNWKANDRDKIPPEIWKLRKFDDLQLPYTNWIQ